MSTFTDEASKRFYAWLRTDVTPEMLNDLSGVELAELTAAHFYAMGIARAFEISKPFADPRLMILAEALLEARNEKVQS